MRSGIINRRAVLAIVSVLAMLMAVLTAAPASAHGSECDHRYVHRHGGDTWKVYPNGVDDTANIKCALEEASHHDGAVVKLAWGTFHVDFLKVDGFNGVLRGGGQDHTRIEPLYGGLDCKAEFEATGFVVWMVFTRSHLKVKNLSIVIPEQACAEPYIEDIFFDEELGEEVGFVGQDFNFILGSVSRLAAPTDQCGITEYGSLTAKGVSIWAPTPDFEASIFNPLGAFSAFRVGGTQPLGCPDFDDLVGSVMIKDVKAAGVGNLIEVISMTDSKVTVKKNHLSEIASGVRLSYNDGTTYNVRKNHMESMLGEGVIIDNCTFGSEGPLCAETASHGYVIHNDIQLAPGAGIGMGIFDGPFDELLFPALLDVKVAKNSISGEELFAGMLMFGNDGTVVAGNHFAGSGVFGMLVDGQEIAQFKAVNNKIVLNSFADFLAFDAGILLAELTAYNIVAGNVGATIVDLGMDNYVRGNVEPEATLESSLFRAETVDGLRDYGINRYGR
ncbi:MAG: hypothetical protein QNJ88_01745 [Acidimicrobiia bacterium]|nr:hypothetical protein [Acidimicrobiia bacterium]